jgi:hypothetical protein
VALASSSGEKVVVLFEHWEAFWQYLQSPIQALVIKVLKREMHLPSSVKEWHIPPEAVFPTLSLPFTFRLEAELAQVSHLLASPRIRIFSPTSISYLEIVFLICFI